MTEFKIVLMCVLAAALALLAMPDKASSHTARAANCELVWQAAPAGDKWHQKQLCLVAVVHHNCVKHWRLVPGAVTVKGVHLRPSGSAYWRNQRHVIGWLVHEALRRKLPTKVAVAAIATTTQESSARELQHPTSFSGSSVGPFQLIDLHGSEAERRTIEFSGNWFYNGAIRSYRANPSQSAVELSDSVQRSSYPRAVAQWIPEAQRTLRIVLGPCVLPRR